MMRSALIFLLAAMPMKALAHVGHLGEVAGHAHWVAGAAIGLAGVIAVWAAKKRGKSEEVEADEEPPETSDEEAEA